VAIIVSLDVHGSFESAWWPTILKGLRGVECPRNLYYLTHDYLKERKANITINNTKQGKGNNQGMPTSVMLRTGTVEYSIRPTTQNQIYKAHKTEAFADGLLIMVIAD